MLLLCLFRSKDTQLQKQYIAVMSRQVALRSYPALIACHGCSQTMNTMEHYHGHFID